MYCNNCGKWLDYDANFCTSCGTACEKSETKKKILAVLTKKPGKRWLIGAVACACALVVLIVILLISGQFGAQYGYDTPEEAAAVFVEAYLERDTAKIVQSAAPNFKRILASEMGLPEDATNEELQLALKEYVESNTNDILFYEITIIKAEKVDIVSKLEKNVAVSRYELTEEEYRRCGMAALICVEYKNTHSEDIYSENLVCIELDGKWLSLGYGRLK